MNYSPLIKRILLDLASNKVYINGPSDAPEGRIVKKGKRGKWYYLTNTNVKYNNRYVGRAFISDSDFSTLEKIINFDPTDEDVFKRYGAVFRSHADDKRFMSAMREGLREMGPNIPYEDESAQRLFRVGLITFYNSKWRLTSEGESAILNKGSGVHLISKYEFEEFISGNNMNKARDNLPTKHISVSNGESHIGGKHHLSESEIWAIEKYKADGSTSITNVILRGDTSNKGWVPDAIRNIDSAIDRSIIDDPTLVYSGVSRPVGEMVLNMNVGEIFQIDTYISTSIDGPTSHIFGAPFKSNKFGDNGYGRIILRIKQPAGSNAIYFGENDVVSKSDEGVPHTENEILLPRGCQFKITGSELNHSNYGESVIYIDCERILIPTLF